jgi:hypothetical protein
VADTNKWLAIGTGEEPTYQPYAFPGQIAYLAIWDRVLSAAEHRLFAGGRCAVLEHQQRLYGAASMATNEQQTVTLGNSPNGGTFTLSFRGQTTSGLAYNASAEEVQTALRGLESIGDGNVGVALTGGTYTMTFTGALAAVNVPALVAGNFLTRTIAVTIATSENGGGEQQEEAAQNEIATVTCEQYGEYTLGRSGYGGETGTLSYESDFASIAAAIASLYGCTTSDIALLGSSTAYDVEFTGALAATDVADLAIGTTNGAGATATIKQHGRAFKPYQPAQNEIQTITLPPCSGGTFTLTFNGETTAGIAWDGGSSAIESALRALGSINGENVSVSGTNPYSVEFGNYMAAGDYNEMTAESFLTTTPPTIVVATSTEGVGGRRARIIGAGLI